MLKTTYMFVDQQAMLELKELLVENFEILVSTFVSDGSERIERLGVGVSNKDMEVCLLYTSPSPRDKRQSRMPSSA